jgi:uncharacterized protein YprB with RNaseH-like and TPR domain
VWLWEHHCSEHGVAYVQHPRCFFRDLEAGKIDTTPIKERIGFLDIETTDLPASWGFTVCYGIRCDGENLMRSITPTDIRKGRYDQRLCEQVCKDLRNYDRLVVFWGKSARKRHDIPFLRARCLKWQNLADEKDKHRYEFPEYMEVYVEDLWDHVSGKLRLHSNSLRAVAQFFDIPAKMTPIRPDMKFAMMRGDQAAINEYVQHCEEDIETTEAVWQLLTPFTRRAKSSI